PSSALAGRFPLLVLLVTPVVIICRFNTYKSYIRNPLAILRCSGLARKYSTCFRITCLPEEDERVSNRSRLSPCRQRVTGNLKSLLAHAYP
ncbi:MAG: hypothetical protein ABGX05_05855, partial [Pirellulaceae bacterium]